MIDKLAAQRRGSSRGTSWRVRNAARRIPTWLLGALCASIVAACGGGGGGPPTGGIDPGVETQRIVNGRVAYRTTGPRLSQFDAAGRLIPQDGFAAPSTPRAAPNVPIEVVAPDGRVLGTDTTDAAGRYSVTVNFGFNPATQVIVRARAIIRTSFGLTINIRPDALSDAYTAETPLSGDPNFDPDFGDMPIPDLIVPLDQGAAAFFMVENLPDGLIRAKSGILGAMRNFDILWRPGNGAESFLRTDTNPPQLVVAGGIAGNDASNQDCWDAPVLMRLIGEYLLAFHFNDVAPRGVVTNEPLIPSVAWREGFLDWWACAGRNNGFFWDTTGIGDAGRVVRYFEIESFFDGDALAPLGPNDPNVYQTAANSGITSPTTIAELLWDLHDLDSVGSDEDGLEFPLFLTLRFLEEQNPGNSYPYLYTLYDAYVSDGSLAAVALDILMREPEDQGGATYPGSAANGLEWPARFRDGVEGLLAPGFDGTLSDRVDTTGGSNPVLGLFAQRYFRFDVSEPARVDVTLTTAGSLRVELLALDNTILASGTGGFTTTVDGGTLILRVTPITSPQAADFDIRVQLSSP